MKTQDWIVVMSIGLMLGAIGRAKLDRTPPDQPEEVPIVNGTDKPWRVSPARLETGWATSAPQDESEAMKAWKERKAALDASGPSFKRPDQIWSPIDDPRSAAKFYKLPANVQSNMWNHVYKQQAEAMKKFVAYMEAQNALDAEKPPQ